MNQNQYVTEQYKTTVNLDARIALHERFSTGSYPWMRWVFDQLDAPPQAAILEVGCGTGALWADNRDRIDAAWSLMLTDQSAGMLAQAQTKLAGGSQQWRFEQCDVQSLPFADATFDRVIANHMLYHVPDLPQGLAEIRRVLKPGGRLLAATNGAAHMREMHALLHRFDDHYELDEVRLSFTLENGNAWLSPYFAAVELRRYASALAVTEAAPLVNYVFSMSSYKLAAAQRTEFAQYVEETLRTGNGVIHIRKDGGLFIAQKA